MGTNLDMDRIAKAMGAERRGKVAARGGYFGALELAAEVAARFRVPEVAVVQPNHRGASNVSSGFPPRRWRSLRNSPSNRMRARCKSQHCCSKGPCKPP